MNGWTNDGESLRYIAPMAHHIIIFPSLPLYRILSISASLCLPHTPLQVDGSVLMNTNIVESLKKCKVDLVESASRERAKEILDKW